jgi:hypothetical protein
MTWRSITVVLILVCSAWGALYGLQNFRGRRNEQYEGEMQDPVDDPPDAYVEGEYAFARLRYPQFQGGFGRGFGRGGYGRRRSWGVDSNRAERHLMQGVRRLTRLDARSVEEIIEADSDEVFNWPWLYAVEVGHWQLTDSQAKRLREYLDRGGFLMVDDFHGEYEWQVFMASLQRILPDRPVVDLRDEEPILHVLYDLKERFQVPGYQYVWSGLTYERQDGTVAHWRAVFDEKGRVQVAICHNVDLGDAWQYADDPRYPEPFTALAYRIGINYILYAMMH